MALLTRLTAADYRRTRWKNGAGWTTELARDPAGDADAAAAFRWRVSIAEVAADGPFSPFPGVDRALLLLEGAGMRLEFADAAPVTLARRLDAARFPGEAAVTGRLLGGPTRDFNAMARRDAVQMTVAAGPLATLPALAGAPGVEWLLHLLDGEAEARAGDEAVRLAGGDSLRVAPAAPARPVALHGAGTAILVRFVALP